MYLQYLERGFSLFPCHGILGDLSCTCGRPDCGKSAGKHPYTTHGVKDATNDVDVVKRLFGGRDDLNIAVATGKPSGVFVFDIDVDGAADGLDLPETYTVTTGRGKHLYFNMPADGMDVRNRTGILPGIDIRGTGGYAILPPSRHLSGAYYVANDKPVVDAPVWLLEMLAAPKKNEVTPRREYNDDDEWSFKDVSDMLACINPDCGYDDWLHVGMALHSAGFPCSMWDNWSRCGIKYQAGDCENRWRGFGKDDGRSMGTIVYMAKRGGWLPVKEVSYISPLSKKKEEKKAESWRKAGGMVGAIAEWISSNAIVQQPVYAFATALTIVSIIKAGRIKTTTNLHPNIYTMCLGPTGSGKENNIECLKLLLHALGMERNIMGRPASGSAIATGLLKSSGVSALCIDELGRYLGGISGKNSQSYQAEIIDVLIDIYSKSGSIFYGKQYANEKQNPQIIIENPYISCIGFTVKERLLEACTGADVLDGFLNRWLIFQTEQMPDESFPENRGLIPNDLLQMISEYIHSHSGDVARLVIGSEPWSLYKDYRKMNSERKKAAGWPLDALYQRSQLQVLKLCMLFSDDDNVTKEQMQMAIDVVEESLLQMISFSDSISNTQHEADLLYVLNVINKWPGINTTGLTNKTRKLKAQDRQAILEQLQVMDKIDIQPTSNKKGFLFYPLQS